MCLRILEVRCIVVGFMVEIAALSLVWLCFDYVVLRWYGDGLMRLLLGLIVLVLYFVFSFYDCCVIWLACNCRFGCCLSWLYACVAICGLFRVRWWWFSSCLIWYC